MISTLIQEVSTYINQWKNSTYLSNYDFTCKEALLENALNTFQTDYNRWFEGNIDMNKVCLTPQLQAVLCYRIAHNVYIDGGGFFSR